jgi:hypothetical protein
VQAIIFLEQRLHPAAQNRLPVTCLIQESPPLVPTQIERFSEKSRCRFFLIVHKHGLEPAQWF